MCAWSVCVRAESESAVQVQRLSVCGRQWPVHGGLSAEEASPLSRRQVRYLTFVVYLNN